MKLNLSWLYFWSKMHNNIYKYLNSSGHVMSRSCLCVLDILVTFLSENSHLLIKKIYMYFNKTCTSCFFSLDFLKLHVAFLIEFNFVWNIYNKQIIECIFLIYWFTPFSLHVDSVIGFSFGTFNFAKHSILNACVA